MKFKKSYLAGLNHQMGAIPKDAGWKDAAAQWMPEIQSHLPRMGEGAQSWLNRIGQEGMGTVRALLDTYPPKDVPTVGEISPEHIHKYLYKRFYQTGKVPDTKALPTPGKAPPLPPYERPKPAGFRPDKKGAIPWTIIAAAAGGLLLLKYLEDR